MFLTSPRCFRRSESSFGVLRGMKLSLIGELFKRWSPPPPDTSHSAIHNAFREVHLKVLYWPSQHNSHATVVHEAAFSSCDLELRITNYGAEITSGGEKS